MGDDKKNLSEVSDPALDDVLTRAIEALREPVALPGSFATRVMTHVRNADARARREPGVVRPLAPRGRRDRSRSVRRLAWAAALTAAAAAIIVAALTGVRTTRSPALPHVRFVLVVPGARSVAVVGDFNHWDAAASPMGEARQHTGTWSTTVAMTPGRHVYSFLIDGTRWLVDPKAPRLLDDDFGRPSAVLTVVGGGRST